MATVCAFVLTRNRKALLVECLRGLLAQTRPPERIVVLDNASTDGTAAHLREAGLLDEPSLTFERSEVNTGGAGGYARGVELALAQGTDWIWLMDDDAEPAPEALERLLAAPEATDPGVAVLANAVHGPDGEIDVMHRCRMGRFMQPLSVEEYRDGHPALTVVSFVGFMVRSSVVRAIGLPRADFFIGCDDVEYSLRARREGRLHLVPESVILHKFQLGGGADTRRSRFWNRLLGTPYPSTSWDGYWKTLYGIRNFFWIRNHYGQPSPLAHAGTVGAYVAKTLMFDERPLRRIPWIVRYAAKGRRGDLTGVTPEEWARIAAR
ncbi:MAG TPA: glycosyltransferase family 2 protein [Solirubrobacteraceae bacterium]|jgi:GT2 family glycosyltransferase